MENKTSSGILIYAQLTRDEFIHTVFFELVNKARLLSQKLGGVEVNAIIFTRSNIVHKFKASFENSGVNKVYCFEDDRLQNYSTEYYSKLFVNLVKDISPEIILMGATNQGRDLAPRVASALGTGLTADCTALDINENGKLAATRPTFGGQLMATILCKTNPQMATVRPNVFKVSNDIQKVDTEIITLPLSSSLPVPRVRFKEFINLGNTQMNSLDFSEIVVAGGKGLKNKEGFELLNRFANKIGATVAATRGAVEMGLATSSIQVGQTGKTVSPRLYIACAISGAIQHTVGMAGSEYVIAINSDENAPIFDVADMGIVGDVFEILPKIISGDINLLK